MALYLKLLLPLADMRALAHVHAIGALPFENEVWTNSHILNSSIPTFAHAMGAGGYDPVLVGRMHSNGPDQLHGYAQRFVGDHGPNHPGGGGVNHGMLRAQQALPASA